MKCEREKGRWGENWMTERLREGETERDLPGFFLPKGSPPGRS